MRIDKLGLTAILALAAAAVVVPVQAEVVEEIVAWVNGDIITKSELETEEQGMIAEVYRRFTGEELDAQVSLIRESVLMQLIDRKVLVNYAQRLYDLDKMGDSFYESFKQQQGIEDDAEFERLLAQEGTTVAEMKRRLVDSFAPEEVIRYEVTNRIAVGDKEIEDYYNENLDQFAVKAEVTIREIVVLAESRAAKRARRPEIEAARNRVMDGEDFGEVAQDVSEAGTKAGGGLLGPLGKGDLSASLSDVAFALPVGAVSEIMEMPYGFHMIKVDARDDAVVRPFEEVRLDVRRGLEQQKYFEAVQAFLEKIRKQADWCVKPTYRERLPEQVSGQQCQSL